jgi:hypothetical protein
MTTAPKPALQAVSPDGLTLYSNSRDLRRDLHTLVNYVRGRTIKRSYRGNDLPAADYKRLLQLIPGDRQRARNDDDDDDYDDDAFLYGREAYSWISYLDQLALRLGFLHYDTKGAYRGYSSPEPSFRDNIIQFKGDAYSAFLALPPAEQERRLLDALLQDFSSGKNEFYTVSIRGRLDRFTNWGSATGLMPELNFAESRRFLLNQLANCAPGVWYSTAELVAYLKATHPFFLIPELPKRKKPNVTRYGNFHEGGVYHYGVPSIPDDAPDGFERVEGRYVERFLEGLPLTLGYVDVAYADPESDTAKPSRGLLRAFRVNERLRQALHGKIEPPRVTVQPNFEIYIESVFYPASLLDRLAPLAEVTSEDTTTILTLRKQRVVAYLAEHSDLDPVALLTGLSGKELPQNVRVELQEWAGHADVFTLYDGFGLVEARDQQRLVDVATVETISDGLRLVRAPRALYDQLIASGTPALRIQHGETAWSPIPEQAHTRFPRPAPVEVKKKAKQPVTLRREELIVLHVPDGDLFEVFRTALLETHSVRDIDTERRTLTVPKKDETRITALIQRVSDEYSINIEDLV